MKIGFTTSNVTIETGDSAAFEAKKSQICNGKSFKKIQISDFTF